MSDLSIFEARREAFGRVKPGAGQYASTIGARATVRFVADLQPESTQAVFSGARHTSQAADLRAFDAAIGDVGGPLGFGTSTTLTVKHTSLRQKRKLNNGGAGLFNAIVLKAHALKIPATTTNATTISDDSDGAAYLAPDPSKYVRDHVAEVLSEDYMPYVQKIGGEKEYLGRIEWKSDESGNLYAIFAHPEGWEWPAGGKGSELVVGFELVHKTYNKEWTADTDLPWLDIATGLDATPDASQPAAGENMAILDVEVELVMASKEQITA